MRPSERYRTWSGSRGKRLPGRSYAHGHPVHLILCALEGRPYFGDGRLATAVFDIVERYPFTLAACLMPDHLHWLSSGHVDVVRTVQSFKSYSTRVAWKLGHRGRLWQRSFYDHVVRRSENLVVVANYIVNNPVRSRLAARGRSRDGRATRS